MSYDVLSLKVISRALSETSILFCGSLSTISKPPDGLPLLLQHRQWHSKDIHAASTTSRSPGSQRVQHVHNILHPILHPPPPAIPTFQWSHSLWHFGIPPR